MFLKAVILMQFICASSPMIKHSLSFSTVLCDMDDRLARGCAKHETRVQGRFRCIMACNMNDTCVRASLNDNNTCFLHQYCPDLFGVCIKPSSNYTHFAKNCFNDGMWLQSENRCECRSPMIGDRCKTHPKTCPELLSLGYESKNLYDLVLDPVGDGSGLIKIRCAIGGTPPNTFHNYRFFSSRGIHSFNKTWQEYRNGFKIDKMNRWGGLENLRRLFKLFPKNKFYLFFQNGKTGVNKEEVFRSYSDAQLSDEESGYKFTFKKTSSNSRGKWLNKTKFGTCLVADVPFSTVDRDNDGDASTNCASKIGSPWWFTDCDANCNIFGFYPTVPNTYPYEHRLRIPGVDESVFDKLERTRLKTGAYLDPL